eukprot:NODE_10039_length_545_cov_126.433649_g9394_i0.p1 GENE.NODE_10039_length_545_cov_126.433649_g9394_i0~~NODE_10039_length_545_cov_126.433649_g9394_i0.p1  ORF type:complete len:160 (-),score=27.08 NODE_10039_length_545_cov_126.433649_g9394_i0:66-503(-)
MVAKEQKKTEKKTIEPKKKGIKPATVKKSKDKKKKVGRNDPRTMEVTCHLARYLNKMTYKNKAPRAILHIKKIARKFLRTYDVRIDPKLNKAVWAEGIRAIPRRIRIRMERKRNENEEAQRKTYTVVSWVPVGSFEELTNKVIED